MAAPPAADGVAVAAAAAAAAHDTPASLAAEASKLGPIDTTGYRRGDGPASAPPAAGSTSPDAPTSSDATLAMGSAGGLAPALRGATSTTFTRRSTPNLDEEDEEGAAVGALASSLAGGSGSGGGSLLAGSTAPLNSVSRTGTIGDLRRSSNAQSDPLLSGGGGGGGGGGHAAVAQQIHSAAREVIMAWGPRTRGFPFNATTRRRFEQYARVTAAIVTDGEIKIKTRTRLFESFPLSFLASDLCTWLMRKCRFIEPVEAVRYAEKLLRYGFILRYDGAMHVAADSTFLTVQASSLWPMESDVPGDLDQYLYLESRIANSPDLQGIERWEIERLTALHELLLRMDITDLEYYKALRRSRLSKFGSAPLKLFLAQERAYWQLARPAPNTDTLITNDLENAQTDAGTADKVRLDSDAYAETLSGDALLAWHEARVRQLQLGEKIPMVKMSFLLDRIMHYTDAVSPVDAFLPWNTQIANPWHLDESHKPPVRSELTVTLAELGLWKSGFAHLMTDPVGVAHFETWCCQVYAEENIRFIRRCQALDTLDRAAYVAEAHAIYTDFLQTGCAHELNLEGPILQAIEAHYPVGADGVVAVQPKIPDTLYNDAVESIMTLCSKDAYHRYLTSDHFTSFEHAVEERHQRQMAAQRHHSHHSLLSTSEKLDRLKYSPSHYNSTGNMLRRMSHDASFRSTGHIDHSSAGSGLHRRASEDAYGTAHRLAQRLHGAPSHDSVPPHLAGSQPPHPASSSVIGSSPMGSHAASVASVPHAAGADGAASTLSRRASRTSHASFGSHGVLFGRGGGGAVVHLAGSVEAAAEGASETSSDAASLRASITSHDKHGGERSERDHGWLHLFGRHRGGHGHEPGSGRPDPAEMAEATDEATTAAADEAPTAATDDDDEARLATSTMALAGAATPSTAETDAAATTPSGAEAKTARPGSASKGGLFNKLRGKPSAEKLLPRDPTGGGPTVANVAEKPEQEAQQQPSMTEVQGAK